jgi:hypothetical protein
MTNEHRFEFKFYALHPALQSAVNPTETSAVDKTDEDGLAQLGKAGWRIVAMSVNPKYADQLLVALQRALEAPAAPG